METTRHFTATAYVVHEEKTALHFHPKLEMWLPPGGHLDRDELPHEAAIREAQEETGLAVTLEQSSTGAQSPTARPIPQPVSIMLEDIDIHDEHVAHQHIDFIYYAQADGAEIEPGPEEVSASEWEWFGRERIQHDDRLEPDVRHQATSAIQSVADQP